MRLPVVVVGGGLAGLYAARLLHLSGVDFRLYEARTRLGGRIFSADEFGQPSNDGFDFGPSWFWPQVQRNLAAVVEELKLSIFPQNIDGDVIFERMSRETPQRYSRFQQEPQSYRIAGGMGALIRAIAEKLPLDRIHLGLTASHVLAEDSHIELTVKSSSGEVAKVHAGHIIFALPPRLLDATVSFSPNLVPQTADHWRNTPTWMAPHAKFFAFYDQPFWRLNGLSGTAQSMVGPLVEIHDATTNSGSAALFGFLGVSAAQRTSLGDQELSRLCVNQLVKLFGPDATQPRAVQIKDWSRDPFTSVKKGEDGGHPEASDIPWVDGVWKNRIYLAGSETSSTDPGYLAGAIDAAERTVRELKLKLGMAT